MDIHLIGPYPPPHGGVSVHIQRLKSCLLKDGHSCTVWQMGRQGVGQENSFISAFWGLYKLPHKSILHFHEKHLLAGLLAAVNKKVIFTVHNERLSQLITGGETIKVRTIRRLTRYLFNKIPTIIAVSESSKSDVERAGFDGNQISLVNAYIPPSPDESANSKDFEMFSVFRAKHEFLITANASALKTYKGVDLYGIDLCLDALFRLKEKHPGVGLVLALSVGRDSSESLENLMIDIAERGLSDRILLLKMSGAYHPILKECELFLRPTNSDGFSLSLAEAIELGIPAIASDATTRPKGCLLFRNRDIDDLVKEIAYTILNYKSIRSDMLRENTTSSYKYIVELYRDLLSA